MLRLLTLISFCTCLLPLDASAEEAEPPWAITLYHAALTPDPIEDVLMAHADYDEEFQLSAIALTRQFGGKHPDYTLEGEVQLAKHTKGQDHAELNALVALRWHPFPWDHLLDTDFAVGFGVSHATEVPPFEAANHAKAQRTLAYILLELELKPQSSKQWSIVLRSHHRSGVFGLFNDIKGAYNSLGAGVKYRF